MNSDIENNIIELDDIFMNNDEIINTERIDDEIDIDIQDETNLLQFIETNFNHIANNDLAKIRNNKNNIEFNIDYPYHYNDDYYNNSPVLSYNGSNNNSDNENKSESGIENNERTMKRIRKISFKDVEKSIEKYYDVEQNNKCFSEIDILSTYIKGQKGLFINSNHYTEMKLNFLNILCIVLSATITSLTPYFCESIFFEYSISAMAGTVTLIILLLNYLKLESSIEKYSQIANTYQSIETSLEFTNTKLFFIKNN
jgi:hypothetical protein